MEEDCFSYTELYIMLKVCKWLCKAIWIVIEVTKSSDFDLTARPQQFSWGLEYVFYKTKTWTVRFKIWSTRRVRLLSTHGLKHTLHYEIHRDSKFLHSPHVPKFQTLEVISQMILTELPGKQKSSSNRSPCLQALYFIGSEDPLVLRRIKRFYEWTLARRRDPENPWLPPFPILTVAQATAYKPSTYWSFALTDTPTTTTRATTVYSCSHPSCNACCYTSGWCVTYVVAAHRSLAVDPFRTARGYRSCRVIDPVYYSSSSFCLEGIWGFSTIRQPLKELITFYRWVPKAVLLASI